jgi:ABC-type transporter Mla MlaB component
MVTSHPAYDDGVLRITCIGSPASLAIAGDIDEYTCAALVDTLRKLTDGLHEIHINLAAVAYCDLAGLRAMILLAGGSANHHVGGTRLVLQEVPEQLKTIVRILGWDATPGLAIEEPSQRAAPVGSSADPTSAPARRRSLGVRDTPPCPASAKCTSCRSPREDSCCTRRSNRSNFVSDLGGAKEI